MNEHCLCCDDLPCLQVEVPLTTSKVEETLSAIEGRKEYYLKKRQAVKDGTYEAEKDPEEEAKKKSASADGGASTSNGPTANGPTANGDLSEDFEHVMLQPHFAYGCCSGVICIGSADGNKYLSLCLICIFLAG